MAWCAPALAAAARLLRLHALRKAEPGSGMWARIFQSYSVLAGSGGFAGGARVAVAAWGW